MNSGEMKEKMTKKCHAISSVAAINFNIFCHLKVCIRKGMCVCVHVCVRERDRDR